MEHNNYNNKQQQQQLPVFFLLLSVTVFHLCHCMLHILHLFLQLVVILFNGHSGAVQSVSLFTQSTAHLLRLQLFALNLCK